MVDGYAQGVTASGVYATRTGAIEAQSGQMRSYGAVDDVGGRLVLLRDGVQCGHVDTGDLRLSHTR